MVLLMMTSVETYLRRGKRTLRRWSEDRRVRLGLQAALYGGSGFCLSAGALMNHAMPLALGLTAALTGWRAVAAGIGSLLGYRLFWGNAGWQGAVWIAGGLAAALALGKREIVREQPILLSALSALIVSAAGVGFQLVQREDAALPVYLLRVALGAAGTALFSRVIRRGDVLMDWLAEGVAVLALSQIAPVPWVNLGTVAAGVLAVGSAFPAAALAGLGLDLAGITPVPMTAVLCGAYLTRLIPAGNRWLRPLAPPGICIVVMGLCGVWDAALVPGLLLGGFLGLCSRQKLQLHHRRGETGLAQVRLELSARILGQTRQLISESISPPVDAGAVLEQVRQSACDSCSARGSCTLSKKLSPAWLEDPGAAACPESGRLIRELHRGREQLRRITADRQRREEYRQALVQQYDFLEQYLHDLADRLPRRGERIRTAYRIHCAARSRGREEVNGDRCVAFPGTGGRYYVALCDGMGTGLGAAQAGDSAAVYLRRMLSVGFPAGHALRSLNSLLTLRGSGGAVTVDLAEVDLSSGTAVLYKWGAAPSWLLKSDRAEKIGTATPPPGLSVTDARESVARLSLRRGEVLILLSDGIEVGDTLGRMELTHSCQPGELARKLLEAGCLDSDDATAAVVCLEPLS